MWNSISNLGRQSTPPGPYQNFTEDGSTLSVGKRVMRSPGARVLHIRPGPDMHFTALLGSHDLVLRLAESTCKEPPLPWSHWMLLLPSPRRRKVSGHHTPSLVVPGSFFCPRAMIQYISMNKFVLKSKFRPAGDPPSPRLRRASQPIFYG